MKAALTNSEMHWLRAAHAVKASGRAVTFRALADAAGKSSTSRAYAAMEILERKGYVRLTGERSGIIIHGNAPTDPYSDEAFAHLSTDTLFDIANRATRAWVERDGEAVSVRARKAVGR